MLQILDRTLYLGGSATILAIHSAGTSVFVVYPIRAQAAFGISTGRLNAMTLSYSHNLSMWLQIRGDIGA